MSKFTCAFAFLFACIPGLFGQLEKPLLLQSPALSATQIVFAYGDDLWIVNRAGGDAHRLVSGGGINSGPIFSPDGTMIAYTGTYDGNTNVYTVPASGGEPRRLSYYPAPEVALGWTPDGTGILFRSTRDSYSRFERLFTVPAGGGFPEELPLPMGVQGSFSPDGSHLVYVPFWNRRPGASDTYIAIRQYRGGKTSPLWIANLADSSIDRIPRDNSNDFNPMWIGTAVYFLSDRNGAVTLFRYDTISRQVEELVKNDGFDLKSASAGPGAIVYEQFGSLHLYDLATGKSSEIQVRVAADLPQVRTGFQKLGPSQILSVGISPTGARAVLETHGEVLTVPAEKGDIRNITHQPGVAHRFPSWSPDGKWIAYFSDESGEYALQLRDQFGLKPPRTITLGSPPSFFYDIVWSPDSRKIAYSDKRLNLWYVDLADPVPVKVDTNRFDYPLLGFAWSPDGRWLAYDKQLKNYLRAIFVYNLETAHATQITDGMSDARLPKFDRSGKYLYFTASTNIGLAAGVMDMTAMDRNITRNVYLAVLRKDLPSPLAPESDDEKGPDAKPNADKAPDAEPESADQNKEAARSDDENKEAAEAGEKKPDEGAAARKKAPPRVTIDFDNISQRIISLPIPAENYRGLWAGKEGVLYLLGESSERNEEEPADGPPGVALRRFDLKKRKTERLLDEVTRFALSANGEKMLYEQKRKLFIVPADKAPKPGDGALKLDGMEVYTDPRAGWRQMYHEIWRIERDFFYDPHFHGLDLAEAERVYEPFLDGIASRADLNYLFAEMLGNMNVQHMFVGGGVHPRMDPVRIGLLGADYAVEHGRYRFARVYNGENWNPQLHAPLTQPGVNGKAGEYLLAVNGIPLHASDDIYSFFQETVGRQVTLKVGPNPDETGARDVTVVPIDNEAALRNLAWIEDNRRKVDQLSGGKLAYVYLPDTAQNGYSNFNRYYFAQVDKAGAVMDERFNSGGQIADYIIDYLRRPLMSFATTREGEIISEPNESIYGPKVMIINEFAGSGGDAMPWLFRKAQIGPLVGTRTWGGLVGIGGYPELIDGGSVTAPRIGIYGLKGQWEVENRGIAPDVEVDMDPRLVREGHDPQLEKAVAILLDALKKNPPPTYRKPDYPDFHPHLPATP